MDDITALVKGRNKDVVEMAKKVVKKLKEEVEKKDLKLSVTENGKEGKSKMTALCGYLEEEVASIQKRRRSDVDRLCGHTWSRLGNESKKAWSERKSEKEEVQSLVFTFSRRMKPSKRIT